MTSTSSQPGSGGRSSRFGFTGDFDIKLTRKIDQTRRYCSRKIGPEGSANFQAASTVTGNASSTRFTAIASDTAGAPEIATPRAAPSTFESERRRLARRLYEGRHGEEHEGVGVEFPPGVDDGAAPIDREDPALLSVRCHGNPGPSSSARSTCHQRIAPSAAAQVQGAPRSGHWRRRTRPSPRTARHRRRPMCAAAGSSSRAPKRHQCSGRPISREPSSRGRATMFAERGWLLTRASSRPDSGENIRIS